MASLTEAGEALRSTKGKENFQRLTRLLICGGVRLLREKFDSFHTPTDLPLKLGDPATKTQLRRARIPRREWDCLYPSFGMFGKSSDFDISLTFRLLRTICNLTEPLTGWDNLPSNTDHSLEADLSRIKFYRNSIYGHNRTMEMTDPEFSNLWREISEALLRISGSISQERRDEWKKSIDELLHEPLTTEAQRYVDELQLWYRNDMEVREGVEQLHHVSIDMRNQLQQLNQRLLGPQSVILCIKVEEHHHENRQNPSIAEPTFWDVVLSFRESFNLLLEYLRVQLRLDVENDNLGSLLITVKCSSLQILEGLWEDYKSGHLNKVAEETLVTAQVLEKLGLDEVKLKTTIPPDGYKKCKEFFLSLNQKLKSSIQEPASLDGEKATKGGSFGNEKDGEFEIKASKPQVSGDVSQASTARKTVKLETYLRYGKISFEKKDVVIWDGIRRPPEKEEKRLEHDWKERRIAKLTIYVDENGEMREADVKSLTIRDYCSIS